MSSKKTKRISILLSDVEFEALLMLVSRLNMSRGASIGHMLTHQRLHLKEPDEHKNVARCLMALTRIDQTLSTMLSAGIIDQPYRDHMDAELMATRNVLMKRSGRKP